MQPGTTVIYYSGLLLLICVSTLFGLLSLGEFFSITPNLSALTLAICLTLGFLLFVKRKHHLATKQCLGIALLVGFVLASSVFLSDLFVDLSWDGNNYHKMAVYALAHEWNPIRESVSETHLYQSLYATNDVARWIDHYPHGLWLIQAALYNVFGDIEMAKAPIIIMAFSLFFLGTSLLNHGGCSLKSSVLVAFIVAMSPVVLAQFGTFYCDAFLYVCLAILVLGLIVLPFFAKQLTQQILVQIIAAFVLCANVKFTGLAYASVFTLGFFALYLLLSRHAHNEMPASLLIRTGGSLVLTLIVSVCVFGFSSYMSNLANEGHPLYPLAGENKVDIISYNEPPSFQNSSRARKHFYALFSEASNLPRNASGERSEPKLKKPLTISMNELNELTSPDLRISGFGVLYSGIILLNIPLLLVVLVHSFQHQRKFFYVAFTFVIISLALLIGLSDSWWARYSPYIYYTNGIILAYFALYPLSQKSLLRKVYSAAVNTMLALLIFNLFFWLNFGVYSNLKHSSEIKAQYALLAEECSRDGKALEISWTNRPGPVISLLDRKVDFTIISNTGKFDDADGELLSVAYRFARQESDA